MEVPIEQAMISHKDWDVWRIIKRNLKALEVLTCIANTRLSLPANPGREVDLLQ